ncbi:MAG TPA: C45 family peptidase, partial [Tepidisphaeraceae bacterium]|nr:C45 family peptidase [Tepidisphaeraceae bacterium]
MERTHIRFMLVIGGCLLAWLPTHVGAAQASQPTPRQILSEALSHWADIAEGRNGTSDKTLVAHLKLTRSEGLPDEVNGLEADFAFQAPDRLRISGSAAAGPLAVGRNGKELWVDEPSKKFAVLGKPGLPMFKAEPEKIDQTVVPPFSLPITRLKLSMITYMLDVQQQPSDTIDDQACDVLRVGLPESAAQLLGISAGHATIWLRHLDLLPLRIAYADGNECDVQMDFTQMKEVEPWNGDRWDLHATAGDHVATVPVGQLVRFLKVAPKVFTDKAKPLGPATGERKVIATEGQGRLEMIDGTRVLFLKGSPAGMGHQQGVLLSKQLHDVCNRILYGVGVMSSFDTGRWFFGEVESAEARLEPYMDKRYLAEMDAMADAAGMDHQEARLANFFPELFHCTGFSLFGKATSDGHMYHGRVLDYLRGVGLEQNAVVMIYQPDYGNAWVNCGYAGFIGSVTAMNEKGISIGEMGGNGYGNWDGKPMAELVREVMEKANTLDEAVQIIRDSPRTCQYYYVISDGKTKQAVGIAATPTEFRVIKPGEAVPELPHAFADAVLMSAGDRYETLAQR